MGEHLMRLDGEAEVLRRVGEPVLDGRFFDQLAEGEVDFDGIQLGRIEIQKFLLREFFGIERRFPARIRPSGSADIELSHSDSGLYLAALGRWLGLLRCRRFLCVLILYGASFPSLSSRSVPWHRPS